MVEKSEVKISYDETKDIDILKESEENVVLFGSVGHGKTTLENKLTGQNFHVAKKVFLAQEIFNSHLP